jgi:hypothetical protein
MSTNRRIMQLYFRPPEGLDFCGHCAALEPQSCDVLAYNVDIESSEFQSWGLPTVLSKSGIGDLECPSPVPESRKTSRDLQSIVVREFGRSLGLRFTDNHAARHRPVFRS